MALIHSFNGRMKIPHIDSILNNRGWIVLHLLDGNDPLYFYEGETPCKLLQRFVLGMTEERYNEEYKKYPEQFDTVAPLLQPKDALLRG